MVKLPTNSRVPPATLLRIIVKPGVPPGTPVTWTSVDGMNTIGTSGSTGVLAKETQFTGTVADPVAIFPRNRSRGGAIVLAKIGKPANTEATVYVKDVAGIGFGCYAFASNGQAVRIAGGFPERSSLADADVAVVGPKNSPDIFGGCAEGGPSTGTYRLQFHYGGRVFGRQNAFTHEIPFEAVDALHPLDVISGDKRIYRLYLSPARGTYFEGWIEEISSDGYPINKYDGN